MNGRTILVTGITGFVGGAVAARLVAGGATVAAVVRADSHGLAVERVAGSLARFLGRDAAGAAAGRMALVVGDLADERTYADAAFASVTHVVHCAACTSFGRADPWPSNVTATRLLAARMQASSRIRRFLHVGTAYCCGDAPSAIVHEDDAPRPEHRHVNAYAQSKAEAELHLRSLDRFPLLVARPSVVVGHASLGVRPSSSLFWYYRALAILGAGPTGLGVGRDVVPADHVAEALERLLFLDEPKHLVYHVSAGRSASTMRGIVAALGLADPVRWQILPPEALGALAERTPALGRTHRERQRVARAVVACSRFGALGIEAFDNERILREGLRPPPPFHEYLGRCVATTGDTTVHDQMVDDV